MKVYLIYKRGDGYEDLDVVVAAKSTEEEAKKMLSLFEIGHGSYYIEEREIDDQAQDQELIEQAEKERKEKLVWKFKSRTRQIKSARYRRNAVQEIQKKESDRASCCSYFCEFEGYTKAEKREFWHGSVTWKMVGGDK